MFELLIPQSELRIGISKAILLFSWQCFTSMCRISYLLSFFLCPDFFFDSVPLITEVPQRFVLSPNVSVLYVWPWLTIFNNVHLFLLIRELLYLSTYSLWFQHYICAVHNFSYYQSFFSPILSLSRWNFKKNRISAEHCKQTPPLHPPLPLPPPSAPTAPPTG